MIWQVLKDETKRFLTTTSVRGVGRCMRPESKILSVIWTLVVLVLLVVCIVHVIATVDDYLSLSVVTDVQEKAIDPSSDDNPSFPQGTLCSRLPIPLSKDPPSPTPHEFAHAVDELLNCSSSLDCEDANQADALRTWLKSPSGYFQMIGLEQAQQIGHNASDFIVDCQMELLKGHTMIKVPCRDKVIIDNWFYKEYFNCFGIRVDVDSFSHIGFPVGIEMAIFLDVANKSYLHMPDYPFGSLADEKVGAIFMLTETGPMGSPMLDVEGIDIPPGSDTILRFTINERHRLSEPYGGCFDYSSSNSTQQLCFVTCFEMAVRNECGCFQPSSPITQTKLDANDLPLCLSWTANHSSETIKRAVCANQVLLDWTAACVDMCPFSCNEFLYPVDTSSSSWPNIAQLREFYRAYILGKSFEPRFSLLKDAIHKNCTDDCDIKALQGAALVHSNFAKFSFKVSQNSFQGIKTSIKTPLFDAISQIGSALNLWSGISVIFAVEVIEYVMRFFYSLRHSESGRISELPRSKPAPKTGETNLAVEDIESVASEAVTEYAKRTHNGV